MLLKFKHIICIPLILLGSCVNNKAEKKDILETHIQKLIDIRVEKFDVTECLTDCQQDSGRLISQSLDSEILKLEVSHWMNCATSTDENIAGFEYKNGIRSEEHTSELQSH